jgi:hypothetical protein
MIISIGCRHIWKSTRNPTMQNATRMKGWALGLGRSATCCADQILEITLIWVVWQATQSSTYTAAAAFAQRAPFWILGFAGAGYVDKVGAIRMLRHLNTAALLTASVGVLLMCWFPMQLPETALVFTALGFVTGVARSMEAPALTVLVPTFNGAWTIQGLNNLLDNSKRVGRLAAPVPALLLGMVPSFYLLGMSGLGYLAMAQVALVLAKHGHQKNPAHWRPNRADPLFQQGFLSNIRRIYRAGSLGLLLSAAAVYAVFHGAAYFAIVPRVLLTQSDGAVGAYASIVGAFAMGGIFSNLLIARMKAQRFMGWVALGMFTAGLSFLLLGQVHGAVLLWLVGFVGGMSLPFQDVFVTCLIQKEAPSELLARAHALWRLGCEAGIGLGMLLGGVAADVIDGSALLIVVGVAIGAIDALLLFSDRHSRSCA